MQPTAALVGRLLLAYMFIVAGWGKLGGFDGTVAMIAAKGLPLPMVLAAATVALELVAGIALAIGFKARWAALALAVFTVLASVLFHAYWAVPAEQVRIQQLMFNKNLAVTGGLLLVFAFGPGRFSLGRS
ncbi:MAG: DoxX family protein [Burkholderiaceae bacterium]|jgi:putative oxidoreductase|nr:DoxX family protein [Burkholderiaceae bacterium]